MSVPSITEVSGISLVSLCNAAEWSSKTRCVKSAKVCADSLLRWSKNRAIVAETDSVYPRDGA